MGGAGPAVEGLGPTPLDDHRGSRSLSAGRWGLGPTAEMRPPQTVTSALGVATAATVEGLVGKVAHLSLALKPARLQVKWFLSLTGD
jgi:hypothetical protein